MISSSPKWSMFVIGLIVIKCLSMKVKRNIFSSRPHQDIPDLDIRVNDVKLDRVENFNFLVWLFLTFYICITKPSEWYNIRHQGYNVL